MMSEAEKKATWITENIITAMPNGKGKKRERPKGCAGEKTT